MSKKLIPLLGCLLFLIACKKEKTSWDTNWDLPIAHGTIDLSDLVADSALEVNGDQSYQLVLEQELYAIKIDTLITIPDTNFTEEVALSFPINASPGFEFAQNTKEHDFDMNGAEIKFLRFSKGFVDVKITSPLATTTKYILEIPNATRDGAIFSQEVIVPPGTTANPAIVNLTLDFAGYEGDLRGLDQTSSNKILTRLIAKIDESGVPITVQTTDTIFFDIAFRELVPDYAQGYFGQQSWNESSGFDLEAMKKITAGALKLEEANFDFIIKNGIKVMGRANLDQITGYNHRTSSIVSLAHPELGQDLNISPATGSWSSLTPSEYLMHFDDGNSNAKSFIENLPDSLELTYEMLLNPFGNVSGGTDAFYPDSKLSLLANFNMPLALGTDSLTYQDTLDFGFQQDFESTHIYEGKLFLDYDNWFPFAAHVKATFIDANNNELTSIDLGQGIQSGITDMSLVVTNSTAGTIEIPVSNNQIMLMNEANRIVLEVIFDTPAYPSTVSIYDNYKIDINLKSNIRARIKI